MEQKSYVLHPVFAQFIYGKYQPKIEEHFGLIHACEESLEVPESGSPFECRKYLPFAEIILKKLNMEEDIEQIAFIYNYLQKYVSEYKKAEKLYERSLQLCERVFGAEHPDTVTSYSNLASVYDRQGKYHKAEELYERSLYIREKVLGTEHPDTAMSYSSLASVYERQGKYRKAEELYEKSLRIQERVLERV